MDIGCPGHKACARDNFGIMFLVFAGVVWFTNYVASQLRQGGVLANSQGGMADEVTDSVEITDSAADDFLRAMGATAAGQSPK